MQFIFSIHFKKFKGLRTLVVAKKTLSPEQLIEFEKHYHQAKMTVVNRSEHMAAVLRRLETDLHLLCLTGVEDRLQVIIIIKQCVVKFIFTVFEKALHILLYFICFIDINIRLILVHQWITLF